LRPQKQDNREEYKRVPSKTINLTESSSSNQKRDVKHLLTVLNTQDEELKKQFMKMFSGLGSIMEKIKEEHQKNKVQDDSDFIDQQDFEEHIASKPEVPEHNDFA